MLAAGVEQHVRRTAGDRVAEAAFWGLAASTLIVGAALAIALPWRRRVIGLVAGFGAGALISAVTLDLTRSAFEAADVPVVVVGLGAGAIAFSAGNWALHRGGAVRHRKRSAGQQAGADPLGIVLGTILDGIPESVVIGISLLAGEGVGLAFLAAVAISNLPEAISATTGLRRTGWTTRGVVGLWAIVAVLSAVAAGAGYGLLAGAPAAIAATIQAFSAGAVLTMLADTMMPEAFDEAGAAVGLATVLGYAIGALLTETIAKLGIPSVLLFGLPERKDEVGGEPRHPEGVVQRGVKALKRAVPELVVAVDACFCEYTTHGHCGVLRARAEPGSSVDVDNDATLENLGRAALSYAQAGADIIAPSGMMDGMIGFLARASMRQSSSMSPCCPMRSNTPPRTTGRSAWPSIRRRPSATDVATRWTLPTFARPCGRSLWTSRKAPTS